MAPANLINEILALAAPLIAGIIMVCGTDNKALKKKFALGFTANWFFSYFLKYLFRFPRPPIDLGNIIIFDPALPSLHTQAAVFVAVFALFVYLKKRKRTWWQGLSLVLFFVLAGMVMFQRYALGRHTPFEILAGAVVGALFAWWSYGWVEMKSIDSELFRQTVHFLGLSFIIIRVLIGQYVAAILSILAAAAIYLTFKGNITWLDSWKEAMRRPSEGWQGPANYFLVIGAALAIFPQDIAFVAILALAVGDAVTTIYGKYLGRVRWSEPFNISKTYMGSLFGFIFLFAVLSFVSSISYPTGVPVFFYFRPTLLLVLSAITVYIEALAPKELDNIYIPFSIALILYFQPLLSSIAHTLI